MKHFLKKKNFQGAGKPKAPSIPKPKPSILRPPNLGGYETLNSFSIVEIVDLISDGPIFGLVNQFGQKIEGADILQALYLNNTPVMSNSKIIGIPQGGLLGSIDLADQFNELGNLYYEKATNTTTAQFKKIKLTQSDLLGNSNIRLAIPTSDSKGFKNFDTKTVVLFTNHKTISLSEIGLIAIGGFIAKAKPYNALPSTSKAISIAKFNSQAAVNGEIKKKFGTVVNANWKEISVYGRYSYGDWELNVGNQTELSSQHFKNLSNYLKNPGVVSAEQLHFINLALQRLSVLDRAYKENKKFVDLPFGSEVTSFLSINLGSRANIPLFPLPSFKIAGTAGRSIYKKEGEKFVLDENGNKIIDDFSFFLTNFQSKQNNVYTVIVPIITTNEKGDGVFTGTFYGGLVIKCATFLKMYSVGGLSFKRDGDFVAKEVRDASAYMPYLRFSEEIAFFASTKCELKFFIGKQETGPEYSSKYNFANVSLEYRVGDEDQRPLDGFKRIYVDYDYNAQLIGPFNKDLGIVERIGKVDGFSAAKPNVLGDFESSVDIREGRNYSNWNDINMFYEKPGVFTHVIENPNVSAVTFSLAINNLYDTIDKDEGTNESDRKIGEKRPAIVRIRVETGLIGDEQPFLVRSFAVIALIEGLMVIDFGSPDLTGKEGNKYKSIRETTDGTNQKAILSEPFILPKLNPNADTTKIKRYIRIYKVSAETNSVLIQKDISLYKITEVIENKLSYPLSAIAGLKLDSRTFDSIPERSYDCRLKKVKVPANYHPLRNDNTTQEDKRYYSTIEEYNKTSKSNKLVYNGDWNGTFEYRWTDNPAWILYDLLTSKRYGLGAYLDENQINKWELYKIGRFCDAVDEDGYFEGVSDGIGGLEPRYSCNVLIKDQTKVYDAIVSITNLFRGMCYFSNSEVHFLDDRPRNPIITFSNTNVKDGIFNYSNIRKDQQYNTIEVSYLDRFENYQVKIEVVEDEQDIRKRGIFKSRIETFGVTSRAMARRIGQHMIYQTIKENQAVEFVAGLEALLCRPGDLIIIEDDLKTRSTNFGRILNINQNNKSLTLENKYLPDEFDSKITVYTPTGYVTIEEMNIYGNGNRSRIPFFTVTTGLINSDDNILSGIYYFNKYENFVVDIENDIFISYPLYTGKHVLGHNLYCYYNTGASGFVFATGLPYQNNNLYDKVISNTGVDQISDMINITEAQDFLRTGFRYSSTAINKRGALSGNLSNKILSDFQNEYRGILPSEINTVNYPQITNYNISGYNNGLNYGCEVFLNQNDININLVPFIKAGSPYRIARKNAEDQIYKILAIKEENQNEYVVVASKYNTGKYVEIENFIVEDYLPNTYYSGPTTVNNVNFQQLNAPKINSFTTGVPGSEPNVLGFVLSGSWQPVTNASIYRYAITNDIFQIQITGETDSTGIITDRLENLGNWNLSVYSANDQDAYSINSLTSTSGIFVAFNNPGVVKYSKAAILDFTIT